MHNCLETMLISISGLELQLEQVQERENKIEEIFLKHIVAKDNIIFLTDELKRYNSYFKLSLKNKIFVQSSFKDIYEDINSNLEIISELINFETEDIVHKNRDVSNNNISSEYMNQLLRLKSNYQFLLIPLVKYATKNDTHLSING